MLIRLRGARRNIAVKFVVGAHRDGRCMRPRHASSNLERSCVRERRGCDARGHPLGSFPYKSSNRTPQKRKVGSASRGSDQPVTLGGIRRFQPMPVFYGIHRRELPVRQGMPCGRPGGNHPGGAEGGRHQFIYACGRVRKHSKWPQLGFVVARASCAFISRSLFA